MVCDLVRMAKGSGLFLAVICHRRGRGPDSAGDFGEKIFDCAKRETKEEADLDVNEFSLVSVADEMRYIATDGKHYLNLGIKAIYNGGEPKVMEPDRCQEWKWFDLDNLPAPLFEGTRLTLRNHKAGKIYQNI